MSVFDAQIESMHELEVLSAFSHMGGSFIGRGCGCVGAGRPPTKMKLGGRSGGVIADHLCH